MIAQAGNMELTLECFAQEAADRIAQLWNERTGVPLSARQKDGLVDGIWEGLFTEDCAETESEARILMHST